MPYFKLNRNCVLRSSTGHMIDFIKGEPTWVPPALIREAASIGAECMDGDVDPFGPEEVMPVQPTQEELRGLMFEAFKDIAAKNDPDEFTGQGVPKVTVVEAAIGLKVTKVEVIDAWQAFRAQD
jgi:hypothetical protein